MDQSDIAIAAHRLHRIARETEAQLRSYTDETAKFSPARRGHYVGLLLVTLGVFAGMLTAITQPFLHMSVAFACILVGSGTLLITMSLITETFFSNAILRLKQEKFAELTEAALDEIDSYLRRTQP